MGAIDYQGLLTELVAIDTTSGEVVNQRRVMDICISQVRRACRDVRVKGDLDGAQPWTLLTNDADPGADRLLFACHVDTVPAGSAGEWKFPPRSGHIDGGFLHGRGAVDMKAGLVATLSAVAGSLCAGVPLGLLLTSDEEIGALGARRAMPALAEDRFGAVVIPEATSNVVHLGHRGALWAEIITRGVSAHGSTPHLGVNAVHKMMDLLQRARAQLPMASEVNLGPSSWNLGRIEGGEVPNVVPAQANAVVDHRTVGNQRQLLNWWRSQSEVDELNIMRELPSVWTPAEMPWLRTLPAVISNEPVPYFTDASYIAEALPGAPVVIWGPGEPAAMHAIDERIALSDIDRSIESFTTVVESWRRLQAEPDRS